MAETAKSPLDICAASPSLQAGFREGNGEPASMQYRTFGKTGWNVSAIGMGCWAIDGNRWGPTDDADSIAAIEVSLDAGVNLLDTADAYGIGHSEELIGKMPGSSPRRADVFIATKFGNGAYRQGHSLPFTRNYPLFPTVMRPCSDCEPMTVEVTAIIG